MRRKQAVHEPMKPPLHIVAVRVQARTRGNVGLPTRAWGLTEAICATDCWHAATSSRWRPAYAWGRSGSGVREAKRAPTGACTCVAQHSGRDGAGASARAARPAAAGARRDGRSRVAGASGCTEARGQCCAGSGPARRGHRRGHHPRLRATQRSPRRDAGAAGARREDRGHSGRQMPDFVRHASRGCAGTRTGAAAARARTAMSFMVLMSGEADEVVQFFGRRP